jgi:endonuclease III-like uncharacterized protein
MMIINRKNILEYADAYDQQYRCTDGEKVEIKVKLLLRRQGFLKKKELVEIGKWKSKRPIKHYRSEENDDLTIKEITKFSFNTKSEKARIKSLLALKGVSWPVASAILHFAFPNKYPIMDFRVIRSLGLEQPSTYNFSFWRKYCKEILVISQKCGMRIRTVEKALWKYDKETTKIPQRRACE